MVVPANNRRATITGLNGERRLSVDRALFDVLSSDRSLPLTPRLLVAWRFVSNQNPCKMTDHTVVRPQSRQLAPWTRRVVSWRPTSVGRPHSRATTVGCCSFSLNRPLVTRCWCAVRLMIPSCTWVLMGTFLVHTQWIWSHRTGYVCLRMVPSWWCLTGLQASGNFNCIRYHRPWVRWLVRCKCYPCDQAFYTIIKYWLSCIVCVKQLGILFRLIKIK
jgi:hypothetical protein